ncbi:hypothetical protein [Bacillus cereus]|uniref:hypothetical protein n=1 Tax=Bacillus cereus TaxID=1396 RepID=UPI000DEEB97B|nr:hypothetical protein [Bacillus cereus]RCL12744.1 hypothetical protein BLO02_027120 [Bacillus cereus]
MAKLDGVKVVNETVEYNGFVYTLVTSDAKVDDIVKASEQELDVTVGAFYLVVDIDDDNDIVFKDNVDDSNYFNQGEHSVFRKSRVITTDKLADAEGVVTITLPDGTKLEGTPSDLEKITRSTQKIQAEQGSSVEMPEEAVEVKQALLKEGDFARVVANTTSHYFEIGTVVKLDDYTEETDAFTAYYLDGSDFWRIYRKDLEPLTKEEAEHIAREAGEEKKTKAERAKWAAIGREVGEIKKGDIVRVVKEGDIGIVVYADSTDRPYVSVNGESQFSYVELVTPVEQRFDTVG